MGNHNSGRRPAPAALTVLRGNPGRRKPNELAPVPPSGEIAKPGWLSVGAAPIWDELAPVCIAMGTLTTADLQAFVTLCELQAVMTETSASKDVADAKQLPKVLRLQRETANGLRPYYEYFGLTPSSRVRLVVPKSTPAEPESKWAGALK